MEEFSCKSLEDMSESVPCRKCLPQGTVQITLNIESKSLGGRTQEIVSPLFRLLVHCYNMDVGRFFTGGCCQWSCERQKVRLTRCGRVIVFA